MEIIAPTSFVEAVDWLGKKGLMPSNLSSQELSGIDTAIRERAFFSARNTMSSILEQLKGDVQRSVEPGRTFTGPQEIGEGRTSTGLAPYQIRARVKEALARIGYQAPEGKSGTIQDLASSQRINLVVKTNTDMARGFGGFIADQNPEALDQYPAQELYRQQPRKEPRDWQERWSEAGGEEFDGRMIAKKNDPIWEEISAFGTPYPPFDFNSGMWTRDVERAEAEELGVIEEGEIIEPKEGDFSLDIGTLLQAFDRYLKLESGSALVAA